VFEQGAINIEGSVMTDRDMIEQSRKASRDRCC
jgi:hypothetical protein